MKDIHKRILSAFIIGPVAAAFVIFGGAGFIVLLIVAFGVSIHEWVQMSRKTQEPFLFILCGGLYILISFLTLGYMRFDESGLGLTVTIFACVWMSDTVAYFFGKKFKGPKLAPSISPNKTISGLIGAICGSTFAMIIVSEVFDYYDPANIWLLAVLIFMGASIGIIAQIGDLLISMMKRHVNVKDTGHLIPGHGGILDRIDSMLLAVPFFYLLTLTFF